MTAYVKKLARGWPPGTREHFLGDVFTAEEIDRAYAIFVKCGGEFADNVAMAITDDVVRDALPRINDIPGHRYSSALYLGYLLTAIFDIHNGSTSADTLVDDEVS
jgi:hypothetical protein